MSKVFVNIGLSLDGYMAPEGMTMENPGYKNWGAKSLFGISSRASILVRPTTQPALALDESAHDLPWNSVLPPMHAPVERA